MERPPYVKVIERVYLPAILECPAVTMDVDWTCTGATADEFEPGVLTITAVHDGHVVKTFHADEWKTATVFSGRDGYADFTFTNQALAFQGHTASRELRQGAR